MKFELYQHPTDANRVVIHSVEGEHMCLSMRVPDAYKLTKAIMEADLWFDTSPQSAA